MANRSKNKGTAWETAVVKWLLDGGFPDATRKTLGGKFDPGDIEPVPGNKPPIIISAKIGYGGRSCPSCNHVREVHAQTEQFAKWWHELHEVRRRRNPDALALLTLHRAGKRSPEYAHWYVAHAQTFGPGVNVPGGLGAIKITGTQALALMQLYGGGA